jgi:cell wall-associated NlpC family hydrolase
MDLRYRHLRRLVGGCALLAVALGLTACASTGATPRPFPTPGRPPAPPSPSPPAEPSPRPAFDAYALVGTALELRGAPYRNGGTEPGGGFDCSGFTQYVFARYGVGLPREVREQFDAGKLVKPDDLAPGDLVFFSTVAPGPSHVGIAIGGDSFVHAPSSKGVVRVERMGASYWSSRFVGIRRVN